MVRPLPLGLLEFLIQLDSFRLARRQRSERLLLHTTILTNQLNLVWHKVWRLHARAHL